MFTLIKNFMKKSDDLTLVESLQFRIVELEKELSFAADDNEMLHNNIEEEKQKQKTLSREFEQYRELHENLKSHNDEYKKKLALIYSIVSSDFLV